MKKTRGSATRSAASVSPMPDAMLKATPLPDVVAIPARLVLSIEGQGAPEGDVFQRGVGALYGVAYTLKFARKRGQGRDFKIGALEGFWWVDGRSKAFLETPREQWRWRLRLAMPDDVDAKELSAAITAATAKKGGKLEGSAEAARVQLERVPAGRYGRILHVGPYAEEAASIVKLDETIERQGGQASASHIEIYLNDPRRTKPDRMKTVLLHELAAPAATKTATTPATEARSQKLHVSTKATSRLLVR